MKRAPSGDGKIEVGLDLIRSVGVDSTHGGQRLRGQYEPLSMPLPGAVGRDRRRVAQFGLGHQPQVSFRTFAVDPLRRVMWIDRGLIGALWMSKTVWPRSRCC